jgi:hypothetical protein
MLVWHLLPRWTVQFQQQCIDLLLILPLIASALSSWQKNFAYR